mgnify:CR=1 FL=1
MGIECQWYYVNCAEDIVPASWNAALASQLTDTELASVQSYVFRKDQERSLLSILLQKYVIKKYLTAVMADSASPQLPAQEEELFHISRTRENKPYLVVTSESVADLVASRGDTFNYNVSHHGDFVGIVSHTHLLMGMDLVDVSTRASWVDSLKEYIDIYKKQLSDKEVETILTCSTEEKCYTHFYVLWSLKEAYVKAVGVGIGIDLKKVEFDVTYTSQEVTSAPTAAGAVTEYQVSPGGRSSSVCGTAVLRLMGELEGHDGWQFEFFSLDGKHVMTVARGLPSSALAAFQTAAWPSYSSSSDCRQLSEGCALGLKKDTEANINIDMNHAHHVIVCNSKSCHIHHNTFLRAQFPTLLTIDDLLVS